MPKEPHLRAVELAGHVDEDLGQLSAEAVLQQYAAAAKSVEDMGDEVKGRITTLEAALTECASDLKLIEEAAKTIKDKGNLVALQVQEAADLSRQIRAICEDFRQKVAEPGKIQPPPFAEGPPPPQK